MLFVTELINGMLCYEVWRRNGRSEEGGVGGDEELKDTGKRGEKRN